MEATSEKVLLATGAHDHTIKLWQSRTGKCLRTLYFAESHINALDQTPDRICLAACGYQCIRLYNLQSCYNKPYIQFKNVTKNVTCVGFRDDGNWMFTAGEDHCVRIWDMMAESPRWSRLFDCKAPINAACLHPNQIEIAMGTENGAVFLWDVKSDGHIQLKPEESAPILDVAISPNGQHLAAVNTVGSCYIWSLRFSPDQRLTTSTTQKKIVAHKRFALHCKFSSDSRLLVTTSGGTSAARIWKTDDDFTLSSELAVENYWVWDADFSADSKHLFTASNDGIVRLWDLQTKNTQRNYIGHTKAITALSLKYEVLGD